jgi:cytochrome c peroxidase
MHNGEMASLADVVRHYSELNMDRLHSDGESILRPLRLTARESRDLVAFLQSLNMDRTPPWRGKEYGLPACSPGSRAPPAAAEYFAP